MFCVTQYIVYYCCEKQIKQSIMDTKSTLKLTVDFARKTVITHVDGTSTFEEVGINEIDRDSIEDHLTDRYEDQYDVEIEFVNPNFHSNAQVAVSFEDLDNLGWDFDSIYEGVSRAQNLSFEEAKKWEWENYHCVIKVNEFGGTTFSVVKDNQLFGTEETGDDEQTIKDLYKLYFEGKLWDIIEG